MKYTLLLFASICFFSCSRKAVSEQIVLPASPPLSRAIVGYGVVNTGYTHILSNIGEGGEIVGILRRGTIVEVLERRSLVRGGTTGSSLFIAGAVGGWVREDQINIYDTQAQAEAAAQALK